MLYKDHETRDSVHRASSPPTGFTEAIRARRRNSTGQPNRRVDQPDVIDSKRGAVPKDSEP